MVRHYLFRFFARCYWQQQLWLLIIVIFLFLIGYSFLLAVSQYHLYQLKQDVSYRQSIIEQYDNQIKNKLSKKELTTTIKVFRKALQPIAFVDFQNKLVAITQKVKITLQQVSFSKKNRKSIWKVQLAGQYPEFLSFLSEWKKSGLFMVIQNIEIKRESEQLLFSVTIAAR